MKLTAWALQCHLALLGGGPGGTSGVIKFLLLSWSRKVLLLTSSLRPRAWKMRLQQDLGCIKPRFKVNARVLSNLLEHTHTYISQEYCSGCLSRQTTKPLSWSWYRKHLFPGPTQYTQAERYRQNCVTKQSDLSNPKHLLFWLCHLWAYKPSQLMNTVSLTYEGTL